MSNSARTEHVIAVRDLPESLAAMIPEIIRPLPKQLRDSSIYENARALTTALYNKSRSSLPTDLHHYYDLLAGAVPRTLPYGASVFLGMFLYHYRHDRSKIQVAVACVMRIVEAHPDYEHNRQPRNREALIRDIDWEVERLVGKQLTELQARQVKNGCKRKVYTEDLDEMDPKWREARAERSMREGREARKRARRAMGLTRSERALGQSPVAAYTSNAGNVAVEGRSENAIQHDVQSGSQRSEQNDSHNVVQAADDQAIDKDKERAPRVEGKVDDQNKAGNSSQRQDKGKGRAADKDNADDKHNDGRRDDDDTDDDKDDDNTRPPSSSLKTLTTSNVSISSSIPAASSSSYLFTGPLTAAHFLSNSSPSQGHSGPSSQPESFSGPARSFFRPMLSARPFSKDAGAKLPAPVPGCGPGNGILVRTPEERSPRPKRHVQFDETAEKPYKASSSTVNDETPNIWTGLEKEVNESDLLDYTDSPSPPGQGSSMARSDPAPLAATPNSLGGLTNYGRDPGASTADTEKRLIMPPRLHAGSVTISPVFRKSRTVAWNHTVRAIAQRTQLRLRPIDTPSTPIPGAAAAPSHAAGASAGSARSDGRERLVNHSPYELRSNDAHSSSFSSTWSQSKESQDSS